MVEIKKPNLLVEQIADEDILERLVNFEEVEKCTDVFSAMRLRGTQIRTLKDRIIITCWLRNMAYVQNNVASFPTFIKLEIDKHTVIKGVYLSKHFKGSQGMICSGDFLIRRMNRMLLGTKFDEKNRAIKSATETGCLHIHEILLSGLSFYEYCVNNNLSEAFESECLYSYERDKNLIFADLHKMSNRKDLYSEIQIYQYKDHMKFINDCELVACSRVRIQYGYFGIKSKWKNVEEDIVEANNARSVQLKLLRIIIKYFSYEANRIDSSEKRYFTCYYPISLVGLIIQTVALAFYSNNIAYFQQSVLTLQRFNNIPKCIGAIKNFDEGYIYFEYTRQDMI